MADNDVSEELEAKNETINAELAAFAEEHPTFADEFACYNETPEGPSITSDRLDDYLWSSDINSEWGFAVKYGYLQGLVTSYRLVDSD